MIYIVTDKWEHNTKHHILEGEEAFITWITDSIIMFNTTDGQIVEQCDDLIKQLRKENKRYDHIVTAGKELDLTITVIDGKTVQ